MIQYEIYYKNEKTAYIEINGDKLEYKTFSEDIIKIPFMYTPQMSDVIEFIKNRCMPQNRNEQMQEYLTSLSLTKYDPWKIIEKTHGVMWEDYLWLKKPDEDISWEDVKIRD